MPILKFDHVRIVGISSSAPQKKIATQELEGFFSSSEIQNVIDKVGISERRYADENTCASDLCCQAAETLLTELGIDRTEIDVLLFVSTTPDFRQPSTSTILQKRLNLSKNTAAFDMNMACSGYVYGLSTACSYATNTSIRKVLLLTGETLSKSVSQKDKATSLLFGDAGTATLLEHNDTATPIYLSLHTDGSLSKILQIPGGGYRIPSSSHTLAEKTYQDGSIRNLEQLYMDGVEVMNFTIMEVPKDIKELLQYTNTSIDNTDLIVFHQANRFITDYFAKKLKIPAEKLLYSIQNYGNTSASSIPLSLCTNANRFTKDRSYSVLISGFGSGMSWGSASFVLNQAKILPVEDYNGHTFFTE